MTVIVSSTSAESGILIWSLATLGGKFSSVQSLSRVQLFATPWTAGREASLSITNSRSLFKLMTIESVMPSNHLILCLPFLLLPSLFPSIRVFSNESVLCLRWPKYWRFNFSISPSNEYSGLMSFRMDWLDLLAVQGILKSLLQHHSSKASVLTYWAGVNQNLLGRFLRMCILLSHCRDSYWDGRRWNPESACNQHTSNSEPTWKTRPLRIETTWHPWPGCRQMALGFMSLAFLSLCWGPALAKWGFRHVVSFNPQVKWSHLSI